VATGQSRWAVTAANALPGMKIKSQYPSVG
jgi:hypothetical protein